MKKNQNVKVVIPCAGNGTRLYPQTLETAKEMLPIGRKPILQIIIESVILAGIPEENIQLVISESKKSIREYFSKDYTAEIAELRSKGKNQLADDISNIPKISNFVYQEGPYGNKTPLENSREFIGESDALYIFPDDLFFLTEDESREFGNDVMQVLDTHKFYGGSILACKKVESDDEYYKYGIIKGRLMPGREDVRIVSNIDEKPGRDAAKSDMASVSMFYLENATYEKIFDPRVAYDGVGESMIQPAIQLAIDDGLDVYGLMIKGEYCDTGNEVGYAKTNFLFSLRNSEIGEEYRQFVEEKIRQP